MIRPALAIVVLSSAVVLSILPARVSIAQATGNKACALVTEAELQAMLGSKVTLKAGSIGDVQTCAGETPSARVLLRLFSRSKDPSGNAEQAGIEAIKKMGAQVDVKTSGGIMCMTAVPPPSMAAMGFGTTCTVTSKAPMFAVIEITAKTQKDMIPMERLRLVADKMASRF
jgi:Flp pilus assembly protein CpaB